MQNLKRGRWIFPVMFRPSLSRCLGSALSPMSALICAQSGVIDLSHQLVRGRPDLIYLQSALCCRADGPLWTWSSKSSSYKLDLVFLLRGLCVSSIYSILYAFFKIVIFRNRCHLISRGKELTASEERASLMHFLCLSLFLFVLEPSVEPLAARPPAFPLSPARSISS